jgi:hypothetical protein
MHHLFQHLDLNHRDGSAIDFPNSREAHFSKASALLLFNQRTVPLIDL